MAGAFPYIGCKIELLSKHGIRYEGTLYTIDPNDSTIALSNGAKPAPALRFATTPFANDVAARWFFFTVFSGALQSAASEPRADEPRITSRRSLPLYTRA